MVILWSFSVICLLIHTSHDVIQTSFLCFWQHVCFHGDIFSMFIYFYCIKHTLFVINLITSRHLKHNVGSILTTIANKIINDVVMFITKKKKETSELELIRYMHKYFKIHICKGLQSYLRWHTNAVSVWLQWGGFCTTVPTTWVTVVHVWTRHQTNCQK